MDIEARIPDRLEVDGLGPLVDRRGERFGPCPVHEASGDPELGQGVLEQVPGPAVQARAGNDVVAGAGQVEDRQGLGGLARGEAQRPDAALEGGDPLLEHTSRWVHDPGIDIAELLQPEESRGVGSVIEDIARRGVDGHRAGICRGVGLLAGMQRQRLGVELGLVNLCHGDLLSRSIGLD